MYCITLYQIQYSKDRQSFRSEFRLLGQIRRSCFLQLHTHTKHIIIIIHKPTNHSFSFTSPPAFWTTTNMQTWVFYDYPKQPEYNHSSMHSTTFGWSDMPYQGEHGSYESSSDIPMVTNNNPLSTMMTLLPESFFRMSSSSTNHSRTSSTSNKWFQSPQQHDHTLNNYNTLNNSTRKRQRRIRFAEHVQIRTHETILGYHPTCTDGLALQCGWAYAETEYAPLHKHSPPLQKLDQMARRQRLREVTGMSHLQLLQLANELLDVNFYCRRKKEEEEEDDTSR